MDNENSNDQGGNPSSAEADVMPPTMRLVLDSMPQYRDQDGKTAGTYASRIISRLHLDRFDAGYAIGRAVGAGYISEHPLYDLDGDVARIKLRITDHGIDALQEAVERKAA